MGSVKLRPVFTSVSLGFASGVIAALMLALMHGLEAALWQGEVGPLRIVLTILTGGLLIAMLRMRLPEASFDTQLDDSREGRRTPLTKAALLAALGIVSVGFGGAIGPEAGILAVAAELAGLVSARIARDTAEARLIGQIGAAGALGGLYGSPVGGAGYANDAPDAPWPLLILAALAGLIGLLLAASVLPEGPGLRLTLPPAAPFDASQIGPALAGGLVGAIAGAVYVFGLMGFGAALHRLSGDVRVQVMAGTALFALLCALLPALRFNGQHELAYLAEVGTADGAGALATLALLKAFVLALCLSAHWLGGPIMPLALAGGAAGAALVALVPGMDLGVVMAAGLAACCTVGMKKPLVVLLVLVFMASGTALMPLVIGVMTGWLATLILPQGRAH